MIKLNLASHGDNREGYVNIDFDHPSADLKADVSNLHMFKDDSVDEILAFHILEHFRAGSYEAHLSNPLNPKTAEEVLLEWYRILKPGGKLEIKVPDFQRIVWLYINFPQWARTSGANHPFPNYTDWICSNGQHQCLFDTFTMRLLLEKVGFKNNEFVNVGLSAQIDRSNLEMYVICQK